MVEFLAALIVALCMLSGVILRYMPFRKIVSVRNRKKLFGIYICGFLLNLLTATVWFFHFGVASAIDYLNTGASIFAIVMTIVNVLFIPGRFGEHVFALGITRTLHFLLLSFPAYAVTLIPEAGTVARLFAFLGLYLATVMITHYFIPWLMCRTIEPFLHLETGSYWNTILFIPIAFFCASAIMVWAVSEVNSLLQMISSSVSCTMMVLMCLSIFSDHHRLHLHQQMEHQLEGQRIHYAELKVRVEDARKLNHNLKHHLLAILGLVAKDDKEGVRRYCDDLIVRISEGTNAPYTGNAAVDGVLYHYMQQAQRDSIAFQLVGVIRSPGIADVDLCALLGNALDNAITACKAADGNRSISVISQSEPNLLSIVIRNTFNGVVKQERGTILSTKDEEGHGYGLASMQSICQHYGGTMQTTWDDSTFTVMLMLPLTE